MTSIIFNNNIKTVNNIKGTYPTSIILKEPLFNWIDYSKIKTENIGLITKSFFDSVKHLHQPNKIIVVHSWRKFLYQNQSPIKINWHFDDPYFPIGYPNYKDNFPCNKQLLFIASDNPAGTSNTIFYNKDITINHLSEKPTWYEIDNKINKLLLPSDLYKCKDGEIIEYDNKTLHSATKSVNTGWRILIKMIFYDREVYDNIMKKF